jgi:carbonic anhydrase/acetyltransferase-like protein (isoleucine patch superfamily)
MPIIPFGEHTPIIGDNCFIAPDAWVTGQVKISNSVTMLFGSVIRGDINRIEVGAFTNLQEHAVLHTSHGLGDCLVGSYVTVGHHAIVHGATVHDNCIIGMGSVILDQAEIGENCIIGAQSLVTMRTKIPAGSLVFGNPAKVIRSLTEQEIKSIKDSANGYVAVGKKYYEYFNKN